MNIVYNWSIDPSITKYFRDEILEDKLHGNDYAISKYHNIYLNLS